MRLRFTIRDLLWLTALIALAAEWWLDHTQLSKTIDRQSRGIFVVPNILLPS